MFAQSLYTLYPNLKIIGPFSFWNQDSTSPPLWTLNYLAETFPALNNFSFYSTHFPQVTGVTMVSCMGPSMPVFLLAIWNRSSCKPALILHPNLFFANIDNCIGPVSCTLVILINLITLAINFYATLKFTWTIYVTSPQYLPLAPSQQTGRKEIETNMSWCQETA